ncbi:MAG: RDD family protein [Chloroflexota bacterium]
MNETTMNLASRQKRLFGALIDGVIEWAIISPIMLAAGIFQGIFSAEAMTVGEQIIYIIVVWVVFLVLNGYLLFTRGQTIGKVAMQTKIVGIGGNVPSLSKLFIMRYLILGLVGMISHIGVFAGLVNVLFIFGQDHRCLHDYLAGTRVVNA